MKATTALGIGAICTLLLFTTFTCTPQMAYCVEPDAVIREAPQAARRPHGSELCT